MKKITLIVLTLFTALSYAQDIELNGTVSAQNNQIKNVANPTDAQDAVTKSYVETLIADLQAQISNLVADDTPSSTIGTLWGGGVVIYIAQPGDDIYIEDEIHGLIAPLNWINPGGGTNPTRTFSSSDFSVWNETASANIGFGKSNTELYMSLLRNKYTDPNDVNSLTNIAFVYCDQLIMNGYNDWFLPNTAEYGKLFSLEYSIDQNSEASVLDYAYDLSNTNVYEGNYAHSGQFYNSVGKVIPGNFFYRMNCCSNGWEKFVPMRYF